MGKLKALKENIPLPSPHTHPFTGAFQHGHSLTVRRSKEVAAPSTTSQTLQGEDSFGNQTLGEA